MDHTLMTAHESQGGEAPHDEMGHGGHDTGPGSQSVRF
jgi:hypothetical protein